MTKAYPYENAPRLPDGEGIDLRALVTCSNRVELEIGPGRGWFMVERVEADPGVAIVGLEVRRKWAQTVDERLARRGFGDRARVFAEDARLALHRLADGCVDRAYVHFPDPWWKKRHQKRLVVCAEVLDQLGRVLPQGGELFVQTDVQERAESYEQLISAHPSFSAVNAEPWIDDHEFVARSPRERKAIEHGLPVYRLYYARL